MANIERKGRMHSPPHPGEILQTMYLKPMGVSITQAADALGVSRKHLSAIVNGRVSVTPDMAARLAAVFGPDVELWINMQAERDVWEVSQRPAPKVKRLKVVESMRRVQSEAAQHQREQPQK
jgi:addiction module HigA family antidote